MPTTYDRNALVNEALSILLVVGAGQTADSEDVTKVNDKIDALFAELEDMGICSVADPDDIPPSWFKTLATLLANYCAMDFGRTPMTDDQRETVEAKLRIMVNRGVMNTLTVDPALKKRRWAGSSLSRYLDSGG